MWLQGSFLAPVTISSRQMMQTLSEACRSSGVASGYLNRFNRKEKWAAILWASLFRFVPCFCRKDLLSNIPSWRILTWLNTVNVVTEKHLDNQTKCTNRLTSKIHWCVSDALYWFATTCVTCYQHYSATLYFSSKIPLTRQNGHSSAHLLQSLPSEIPLEHVLSNQIICK